MNTEEEKKGGRERERDREGETQTNGKIKRD
jgi:hypothetical protein